MLSLKSRVLALAATGALAASLAVPAFAQALWADFREVPTDGGIVALEAFTGSNSTGETVSVTYQSSGPSASGPTTLTVPAGGGLTSFDVAIGPGESGDAVRVGMTGPNTNTVTWIEMW